MSIFDINMLGNSTLLLEKMQVLKQYKKEKYFVQRKEERRQNKKGTQRKVTAFGDHWRGKTGEVKSEEDLAAISTNGAKEISTVLKQFGGCTPQRAPTKKRS